MRTIIIGSLLGLFAFVHDVAARAGGGGSGGGGGGGGGSGGGGSSGDSGDIGFSLFVFAVFGIMFAIAVRKTRQRRARTAAALQAAAAGDRAWEPGALERRVTEVFTAFQSAWSAQDAHALAPLLTEEYRKRIVLELAVLAAEHRRNVVGDPKIIRLEITDLTDAAKDHADRFTAEITARANDALLDTTTNRTLFRDTSEFTEYWTFAREDGSWQLDRIRQSTEDPSRMEQQVIAFAGRHGFHYDADFGWLMLPNQGFLFRKSNFKTSDINNHVIGHHREKVVEFYTFIPRVSQRRTARGFLVAQAVLPKRYHDILIRRRRWWSAFLRPRGLRRITLESPEFNRRFCLWAHPLDQANSLELLHPTFMERVASLPFALDIEIVGNILYLATKDRQNAAQFDQMLDILNGAFDEMER